MKGKLGVLFLVAVLFLGSTINVWATVGPVHVELNMLGPSIGHARANQKTAFKVYMRYNITIKNWDEINIWFPAFEAFKSDNPEEIIKNFCDGRQKIDEKITDPRFVPNEEYFKKFNNPELKKVKQLYEIAQYSKNATLFDCPDLSGLANWEDACNPKGKFPSMIKDPSGLGCWLLGTVMPSMPIDENERWEKLKLIARSASIGYNPCDCEPLTLTSTCHERLLKFISPLEVEAWRKGYNAIDLNTSSWTGIISPATPGRYYVKVATTPEPEPVESEAFVLPCSDISDVKLEQYPVRKKPTLCSVSFKTGEGGALDNYYSHIFVRLPKQFKVTEMPENAIVVNGEPVKEKVKPVKDGDYSVLDIKCPANVDNFSQTRIDFLNGSGISIDYSKGLEGVSVSTSSEPNFIKSPDVTIPDKPETTFGKPEELVNSSILIRTPLKRKYPAKTIMTLAFPKDFTLPSHKQIVGVLVNGRPVTATGDDKQKMLTFSYDLPLSTLVSIFIPAESGITNPPKGNYSLSFNIGDETLDCGSFEIGESKIFIGDLAFSVDHAAMHTRLSFSFKPSSSKPLKLGDWIAITFPEETKLPDEILLDQIKIGGFTPTSIEKINLTLKIVISTNINANVKSLADFNFEFVNPRHNQNFILKVETSLGDVGQSEPVDLLPAPLQTNIYFKDPDKPNCGNWFNKPPILGFECLNPEAKIVFWYNDRLDRIENYAGEHRMYPGWERAKITWQAEFNGQKEDPQSYDFCLDTIPPILVVFKPKSDSIFTNKTTYTVEGERGSHEMLTYGDNSKYQVTDSVFIKVNGGQEQQLLQGEIYETEHSSRINYKFSTLINLDEGENNIEIIGRDQACNETIIKKKIILDTKPPKLELIEPMSNYYYPGQTINLKVKTEPQSVVFIDDKVSEETAIDDKQSVYWIPYSVATGENKVKVSVADTAGNQSKSAFNFKAKTPVKIELTLESTVWLVNGVEPYKLVVAPTTKIAQFKGVTFVAAREVVHELNCKIFWNSPDWKTIIEQEFPSQPKRTIELWIGKNLAKIDGRDVSIGGNGKLTPVTINGRTMIPLRFLVENLRAKLDYNQSSKKITISYPFIVEEK